jgi:hypothetical protein
MAVTHKLIETITVGSGGAASIEFTSIPQTYTDLMLVYSARGARVAASEDLYIRFNGLSTNLSSRVVFGNGASAASFSDASINYIGQLPANTATSSVFGNGSIYIPNYTSATAKSMSGDAVTENNATTAITALAAGLWNATSPITQINLYASVSGSFLQFSSASLYGISKS